MKVLLLTFYYPPDLSAGSFRAAALVDALLRISAPEIEVDVLTSLPHRYSSFRAQAAEACNAADRRHPELESGRLSITRLPVGAHRGGLADQSVAFSGFAVRALRAVRNKSYDIVIATTSRLFTGYLGSIIASRTGAKLCLDVRDLFVHNMRDMYRASRAVATVLPVLSWVERRTFRRAGAINLVSEGFLEYCSQRFPKHDYSFFSNGIDPEFLNQKFDNLSSGATKRIVYAGNIGLGQGLETIVPAAARRLGADVEFRIVGDGGRRQQLADEIVKAGVTNVKLEPPADREAIVQAYREADVLFLHLNKFDSLQCVLPSKIFEYAATGKPILAGVSGYARKFLTENVENSTVFEPGDSEALVKALHSLEPGSVVRSEFNQRFARSRIMDELAATIVSIAPGASAEAGESQALRHEKHYVK